MIEEPSAVAMILKPVKVAEPAERKKFDVPAESYREVYHTPMFGVDENEVSKLIV